MWIAGIDTCVCLTAISIALPAVFSGKYLFGSQQQQQVNGSGSSGKKALFWVCFGTWSAMQVAFSSCIVIKYPSKLVKTTVTNPPVITTPTTITSTKTVKSRLGSDTNKPTKSPVKPRKSPKKVATSTAKPEPSPKTERTTISPQGVGDGSALTSSTTGKQSSGGKQDTSGLETPERVPIPGGNQFLPITSSSTTANDGSSSAPSLTTSLASTGTSREPLLVAPTTPHGQNSPSGSPAPGPATSEPAPQASKTSSTTTIKTPTETTEEDKKVSTNETSDGTAPADPQPTDDSIPPPPPMESPEAPPMTPRRPTNLSSPAETATKRTLPFSQAPSSTTFNLDANLLSEQRKALKKATLPVEEKPSDQQNFLTFKISNVRKFVDDDEEEGKGESEAKGKDDEEYDNEEWAA